MDERLKFVARLLDGEKMAGLCRDFGIARKPACYRPIGYVEFQNASARARSRGYAPRLNTAPAQSRCPGTGRARALTGTIETVGSEKAVGPERGLNLCLPV
jgi:hypothetical protein